MYLHGVIINAYSQLQKKNLLIRKNMPRIEQCKKVEENYPLPHNQ